VPSVSLKRRAQGLGPLQGRARADIEADLVQRGYTETRANSGGSVWTKPAADGNTADVRIDPAKVRPRPLGYADEVPQAHKETVPSSAVSGGNYRPCSATALDDAGNASTSPATAHIPIIW
jgi:hypothetical protein